MQSGIVYYKRSGSTFDGRWSHQDTGGVFAREVVHDAQPGPFVGSWQVEIFAPDGRSLFVGQLQAVPLGDCVSLSWTKTGETAASFVGLGHAIDPDLVMACFEPAGGQASQGR
ncbi:hypothetical protein JQ557_18610 [Bradyrhizobium sp. U87765 SZCCT0131]|uniref:hypothetical protein n=1 Tax=unclassified Bradyrhizobium TaxID=2631580 RepID=UPI001BA47BAB|nr:MULTISPECIES: hypothetical protein [unclassified Bradyrhizobium]MBR1220023.1 hypothetical protein [Bradyrhizobium sp. U87765 SZCCT0131]MBR1263521.1 hypothetical protein [Bradyrhizobium sp. U87765 SZCCT0134]MBR1309090.1 hypothetical protein [Bradyrhizobium sp. U87765 SZCCT0110]MBR1323853.1 hypothetical protein [Bradyrhizobium sp. U87765 SZCCT0109]MBR1349405.1 hypothetical protein [Bradyrhizobium sp. U87765 SZCCT0048]